MFVFQDVQRSFETTVDTFCSSGLVFWTFLIWNHFLALNFSQDLVSFVKLNPWYFFFYLYYLEGLFSLQNHGGDFGVIIIKAHIMNY